jgi:hypothetical protein
VKDEFVDDPRTAVQGADALVGECSTSWANRSTDSATNWSVAEVNTLPRKTCGSLGSYHKFFDRLLTL